MPERNEPGPMRVLVVDDEPGMLKGVRRALEACLIEVPEFAVHLKLEVQEAATGESALEQIRSHPPDLILLDHKLPGISGMDLLKQLRPPENDFLIIVISAYASLEMAVRATKGGAYDMLAKPFTPDELKHSISKAARHLLFKRQASRLDAERKQVRSHFLSTLAHELKAPLAAVRSYLTVLEEWPLDQNPEEYRRIISRCGLRVDGMRKLILDLLDLTSIESGQKRREIVRVDCVEVARAAIETLRAEAKSKGITLDLDVDEEAVMEADPYEIEMILNNLLSNAVKYNRENGRVEVRLDAEKGNLRISVTDSGIGLKPEEIPRLFGEFARIRNEKTEKIVGSGLGLSIVKKIAELYGGRVDVRSQYGEGSTFTVHLPGRIQ